MYEVLSCPYKSTDRIGCLNVFDTNFNKFFIKNERAILADFLDGPVHKRGYWALRIKDEVVACCGLKVLQTGKSAFLSWGMVAQPYNGKGIGHVLTEARLHLASQAAEFKKVTLNTSQHTKGFYKKFGFVPV